MKILGERLRELRLDRDLTQDALANDLHLSKQIISNYENGSRSPDIENLKSIAVYFDVSADYLLGLIDQRKHENVLLAEHIGLSDNSIDNIRIINSFTEGMKECINGLLEHKNFFGIIQLMHWYVGSNFDESDRRMREFFQKEHVDHEGIELTLMHGSEAHTMNLITSSLEKIIRDYREQFNKEHDRRR